jgi:hypothetical protein
MATRPHAHRRKTRDLEPKRVTLGIYHATTPKYGFDLWAVSLAERKVVFLKETLSNELHDSISRDSRWRAARRVGGQEERSAGPVVITALAIQLPTAPMAAQAYTSVNAAKSTVRP